MSIFACRVYINVYYSSIQINWEYFRILVDAQTWFKYAAFDEENIESAEKNLRIQKYLDTCGPGLTSNQYLTTSTR